MKKLIVLSLVFMNIACGVEDKVESPEGLRLLASAVKEVLPEDDRINISNEEIDRLHESVDVSKKGVVLRQEVDNFCAKIQNYFPYTFGNKQTCRKRKNIYDKINASNIYGVTPLIIAMSDENYLGMKALIEAGVDINAPVKKMNTGTNWTTPLMHAVQCDNYSMVKALIEAGVDTNAPGNESGVTALEYAKNHGCGKDIVYLLKSKDDKKWTLNSLGSFLMNDFFGGENKVKYPVNIRKRKRRDENTLFDDPVYSYDQNGHTPLINAVRSNNYSDVKRLIELGVDPNDGHLWSGNTPLIYAAGGSNYVMVRLLVEAGAIDIPNEYGHNALWYAKDRGCGKNILNLLETENDKK